MQQIAELNSQLAGAQGDQRLRRGAAGPARRYIDQLSQLMDIRVVTATTTRSTSSPIPASSWSAPHASQLSFDAAGHGDADDAVECRSDQEQRSARSRWCRRTAARRPDRQQVDPLRQDRRLSRHARQRAGAGAEPARRAWPRRWRRRCRTTPSRARRVPSGAQTGFRRRYRGPARRQQHQSDLHRHADQHPAPRQHRAGRRSGALPLSNSATADPNDEVVGVDFSGGLASVVQPAQRAVRRRAAVLQSVRHDAAGAG